MGDFDLAYNGELISQKFPPTMSVEPMRYESYQPPLYYLIATPIYGLVAGFGPNNADAENGGSYGTALIALRLFGVLLAAISLGLLYACAATIFPAKPTLSIGATAFAAALPMHAAITASVNNDTLAELLVLASVLVLLRWMRQRLGNGSALGQAEVLPHPNLPQGEGTVTGWTGWLRSDQIGHPIAVPPLVWGRLGGGSNSANQTTQPQPANNLGGVSSKFTLPAFQPHPSPLLTAALGEGTVTGGSAWLRSDQIGRPKTVPSPWGRLGWGKTITNQTTRPQPASDLSGGSSQFTLTAFQPHPSPLLTAALGEGTVTGGSGWLKSHETAPPVTVPSPRGRLGWGNNSANQTRMADNTPYLLPFLGLLLGLGLLTKIYVYALLPICLLMVLLVTWRTNLVDRVARTVTNVGWVLAPALLIGLPMWIRNMRLYGLFDPLGLSWHDLVVAGQPTLNDWIMQHGWPNYWVRALSFTFRSFWGVFGWLSIFLDERIYTLFTIFSAVVAFGVLWALGRLAITRLLGSGEGAVDQFQRWALLFLGLMLLTVFACYVLYNLKFVQHQGRYLFWGLLPIGLLVAAGWREVMRTGSGRIAGVSASIFCALFTLWLSVGGGELNKWALLIGGSLTLFLLLRSLLLGSGGWGTLLAQRVSTIFPISRNLPLQRLLQSGAKRRGLNQLYYFLPFMVLFLLSIIEVFLTIKPQLSLF